MSHPSVLVYGPHGSGKTRNSRHLAAYYDLPRVIDDWTAGEIPVRGALVLTNDRALFDSTPLRFKFHIEQLLSVIPVPAE